MWLTNSDLIKKQANFWDEDLKSPGDRVLEDIVEYSPVDLILPDSEVLKIYQTDPKDLDKTNRLMDAMRNGAALPPILIKENLEVVDGYHRVLAARQLGLTLVPCICLVLAKP
jgi:ParB-like chromosome segregation protein Spo0J